LLAYPCGRVWLIIFPKIRNFRPCNFSRLVAYSGFPDLYSGKPVSNCGVWIIPARVGESDPVNGAWLLIPAPDSRMEHGGMTRHCFEKWLCCFYVVLTAVWHENCMVRGRVGASGELFARIKDDSKVSI
jgi:hypothetical protein